MLAVNIRQFNRFYWICAALMFVVVALRCALVPFAHDEVATFNYYIQSGNFLPFLSHVDAMGHFLPSATAWMSFKLFGSSPLALRLPCLLSFIVLAIAVFKLNNLLSATVPKLVLTVSFIFAYNFVAFFSLCRGYGMSMAFLLLALYYFFCYTQHASYRHFVKYMLFSQLALSANLTLVFVLLITTGILIIFQLRRGNFFTVRNILFLILHFGLIGFWVKFAFFLQENGALYYGSGDGYWQVTFKTLIETIAFKSRLIKGMVLLVFAGMCVYFCFGLYRKKLSFVFSSHFAVSFVTLCGLIVSFYLLKKLLGVNYPEDRTGLFFYVLYVVSLSFMIGELKEKYALYFLPIPLFFLVHFVMHLNFRAHPWRIYETIPERFYQQLVKEQEADNRPITIAGHRLREFIYGFLNYNSPQKLNPATSPEALQMNCDYAIAYDLDKPYYEKYYSELDSENDWGFRLLKRKKPIERRLLFENKNIPAFTGDLEFYNAFEKLDTTFNVVNPVQAEFDFSVKNAPVPFNAWLVLQIDSKDDNEPGVFVRAQLNLIQYDWKGTANFKLDLVSGNIPLNIKRVVCYLWNIDKQQLDIKINAFRLYRLEGEGVTEISKAQI